MTQAVAAQTVTCRRCSGTVALDSPEKMTVWAPRGARLQCDRCGADLGRLETVLRYLEAKA